MKIPRSLSLVINGEPCSKANSRIMIFRKNCKPQNIKSKNAQNYVNSFLAQVAAMKIPCFATKKEDVVLKCWIYYGSYRKDLDESLIMDCLQKSGIIENDRQIKEKHIYHGINKINPQAIIILET